MFKVFFVLVALFTAQIGQANEDFANRYDCQKVATLESNHNIDILYCAVSRFKSCFATNVGGLECNVPAGFSYRASDYGRTNYCDRISTLTNARRGGNGPYLARAASLEVCSIGRGRRAIKCNVTSVGGLSCY